MSNPITYGHRLKNNRHPVRSAKDKLQIDQLVVGWVTTSEYWLLYVFDFFFLPSLTAGGWVTSQSHWSLFLPAPHELQQSLYFSIQNHAIVALCITILKSEETEAKKHPANNFTTTVFPLVHNPPPLLPPILLPPQLPALRPYSRSIMGRNPGNSPPSLFPILLLPPAYH